LYFLLYLPKCQINPAAIAVSNKPIVTLNDFVNASEVGSNKPEDFAFASSASFLSCKEKH
jgi:hypothetical protein